MCIQYFYLFTFVYTYFNAKFVNCLQARLRLADIVEKEDVNEAMRLMEMSKDSLNSSNEHGRWGICLVYIYIYIYIYIYCEFFGLTNWNVYWLWVAAISQRCAMNQCTVEFWILCCRPTQRRTMNPVYNTIMGLLM